MARKPLNEYYDRILEESAEDCFVGYDGIGQINKFCFEEDGYFIDVSFEACGDHGVSGDGYWNPRHEYLRNIEIFDIEIGDAFWQDPETGEVEEISQAELDGMIKEMEEYLPEMLCY